MGLTLSLLTEVSPAVVGGAETALSQTLTCSWRWLRWLRWLQQQRCTKGRKTWMVQDFATCVYTTLLLLECPDCSNALAHSLPS